MGAEAKVITNSIKKQSSESFSLRNNRGLQGLGRCADRSYGAAVKWSPYEWAYSTALSALKMLRPYGELMTGACRSKHLLLCPLSFQHEAIHDDRPLLKPCKVKQGLRRSDIEMQNNVLSQTTPILPINMSAAENS